MAAEYRADGWPLCPKCGADELMSKTATPSPTDELLCLLCLWHGRVEPAPEKGWLLWGPIDPVEGSVYHVYPTGDLREHVTDGGECWCHPTRTRRGIGWQVVHNAADGRELIERHGVN